MKKGIYRLILRITADFILLIGLVAIYLNNSNYDLAVNNSKIITIGLIIRIILFLNNGYGYRKRTAINDFELSIKANAYALIFAVFSGYILKIDFNRHIILIFLILILVDILIREILLSIYKYFDIWFDRVYINADYKLRDSVYSAIINNKDLGFQVLGFIEKNNEKPKYDKYQSININDLILKKDKSFIIIHAVHELNQDLFHEIKLLGIRQYIIPQIDSLIIQPEIFYLLSSQQFLLLPNERFPNLFGNVIKRTFDLTASLTLIILMLPFIIPIMLYIKISNTSIIFKHKRIGKNGKLFSCYKIKTMKNNADEILIQHLELNESARKEWNLEYKLKKDPRVTHLGRILRKLSIDELPQLFNVVKGDMSLVGPRPITNNEIKYYGNYFDDYKKVRPGITGLWQISGRSDVGYQQRVLLDAWYVSNQSLKLDIFILIKTISVLITLKGAY